MSEKDTGAVMVVGKLSKSGLTQLLLRTAHLSASAHRHGPAAADVDDDRKYFPRKPFKLPLGTRCYRRFCSDATTGVRWKPFLAVLQRHWRFLCPPALKRAFQRGGGIFRS